jgi:two-component system cell cycle sensor histidine kinase/response regulator CckA
VNFDMAKKTVCLEPGKGDLQVLIVEQDVAEAQLCINALRDGGYIVHADIVGSPKDFLSQLNAQVYDAVIADYLIPGWSGMDAFQLMRQEGIGVPFLLITHALGDEEAISCIQQGVASYVLKDHRARLPQAVDCAICDHAWMVERLRSEEALKHSETHYRELVENATFGICRTNVQGGFLQVNASLVGMLGYESKEELISLPPLAVYRNTEDHTRVIEEYSHTGRVHGIEVEWKSKSDSRLIVCLSVRGVSDESGALQGLEIFVEDVTKRRALEKQLHHAQKFEAIGQLAGGIAHDFNNVIGAVMGWAELGSDQSAGNPRLSGYFNKILAQAQRAAGLTRQLLAFARRQILEPQNVNLNTVVTDVMSLLEKVISKDILIQTLLAADLATVRADSSQIEQVLMNLCLNARDAMPRGGNLIIETRNTDLNLETCRVTPGLSPGKYVELTVSDNGTGIDVETKDHIFEPFFTTKEPGKGTGLGLATVFGIVRQHGGFVSVESEAGKGCAFRILLPAAAKALANAGSCPAPIEHRARGGSETILIADDHEGMREVVHTALGNLGYHVLQVADGEEAVRVFQDRAQDIALAVLDMVMPRLGGCEAADRIHAIRPDLPVIFTTAYNADSAALARVVELGGVVLQKPYNPHKLAQRVRELLNRELAHARVLPPGEAAVSRTRIRGA